MAKLTDLQLGKTARKSFTFTRKTDAGERKATVLIEILSSDELDRARVNAEAYYEQLDSKHIAGRSREEIVADARTVEVLALALKDSENPNEPWAGANTIRGLLTTVEIGLLSKAYEDHQNEVGPIYRNLTPEVFEAMLEAVAKEGSADPLVLFDWHTQRSFITTTVAELKALRMAKSSPISDSSEPEKDS